MSIMYCGTIPCRHRNTVYASTWQSCGIWYSVNDIKPVKPIMHQLWWATTKLLNFSLLSVTCLLQLLVTRPVVHYSSQPEKPARVLKQNWHRVTGILEEFDEDDQNGHLRHACWLQGLTDLCLLAVVMYMYTPVWWLAKLWTLKIMKFVVWNLMLTGAPSCVIQQKITGGQT